MNHLLPRKLLGSLAAMAALWAPNAAHAEEEKTIAHELAAALSPFVASLDDEQRALAQYAFEDDERLDLRLAPMGLEGLQIAEMSETQWSTLRAAFGLVLSPSGLEKVDTIRSLEREVEGSGSGFVRFFFGGFRDVKRYFLALFGEPGDERPWGLRFDGHHVSLNWTAVPGSPISVTPLFLGGQPREVPAGFERAGLRVLADEETMAALLVRSLDDAERAQAMAELDVGSSIFFTRPMFVGADPTLSLDPPSGLARSDMKPAQQQRLDALIDVYLGNFAAPIANRHRKRIATESDAIHFLFAGSFVAGEPSYYRIQAQSFLIEFDNTERGADHVHVVWRELQGDFGRDLLAEHRKRHH